MKHLLDIPDLDPRAFMPVAGRMRLFGKSDAPAAPDYVGQAQQTAAGNLELARAGASANRIDQTTPYGTINYTRGTGFDQAGYDKALRDYAAQQAEIMKSGDGQADRLQYFKTNGTYIDNPTRDQFITDPDKWTSTIKLSDAQQKLLDASNKSQLGLAGLQDSAMSRVASTMGQPLNISDIPGLRYNVDENTGMDAWDKATDLIRQRQNPELDRQQAALDTKLANQGLTQGSEGWGIQQGQFGQQRNDADIAAQLSGLQAQQQFFGQAVQNAGLNNQTRQQGINERVGLRQLPLNELNALRTGAAVTNPTFNQPGQQQLTAGADLLGASGAQYNAALGDVNAKNQQAAANTSAGVGLASAAMMAFY